MMDSGTAVVLALLAGSIALIFTIATVVVLYVLSALGIANMAKARGLPNPNYAWIPIYQFFVLGKLLPDDELDVFGTKLKPMSVILLVAVVAKVVLGSVPVLGVLIALAYAGLFFFVFQKLYENIFPNAVVYAALIAAAEIISGVMPSGMAWIGSLLSLVMPITLFIAGRKEINRPTVV